MKVTFIPSWKIWMEVTDLVGRFETDDAWQRTTVIAILLCLVGYTSVSHLLRKRKYSS